MSARLRIAVQAALFTAFIGILLVCSTRITLAQGGPTACPSVENGDGTYTWYCDVNCVNQAAPGASRSCNNGGTG